MATAAEKSVGADDSDGFRQEMPDTGRCNEMADSERLLAMSMDAARARFPECPQCGYGVDENDPETPYAIVRGELYHARCYEAESGRPLVTDDRLNGWQEDEPSPQPRILKIPAR